MTEIEQYFLDANFLISYLDERDHNHKAAHDLFKRQDLLHSQMFMSDLVINEVMTSLARRCENKKTPIPFHELELKFRTLLKDQPILCLYEILYGENFGRIRKLMLKSEGHLNFHDCLIAIFLKEVPRVKLVSFDSDFDRVPWIRRVH